MPSPLERLKTIGFVPAGRWYFDGSVLVYDLDENFSTAKNVLYSFIANAQVMYIGKTTQPLKARIANYKYATRATNLKNKTNIDACIKQGMYVDIWVLPDNGLLHYGGFHVNLAAGLEDSLIREIRPPWNGGKKESSDESLVSLDPIA